MLGKDEKKLDIATLDELCQERKHQRLLNERTGIQIPHSQLMTRPYGVTREGEAYDVWHHILDQVTDPPEIKTQWEISGMFRDILRGRYIETILPEIVKLISDRRPQYWEYPEIPGPEWYREAFKERIERRFRTDTFLNLRLLSTQCKRSVEYICHAKKLYRQELYLGTVEEVQRIHQKLEKDPFIAASHFPEFVVSVGVGAYNRPGNLEPFHQAIGNFLQLAGHKIRHFEYYNSWEAPSAIYNCLREWASSLPNMEQLYLDLKENDGDVPELEEIQHFPKLPRLRSIEQGNRCSGIVSSPLLQRILEACPGIQDLQLFEGVHERKHSRAMLETLSNLTCLRIFPYRELMLHRNLPWKLKRLQLGDPNSEDYRRTFPSLRLFSFLKQFEETLEHLELEDVDFFDCYDDYLDLKNLKTLKMELHESYKDFNFLLYAEKLESLEVIIETDMQWSFPRKDKAKMILSGSFLGKTIWDVFPSLKWYQLCDEGTKTIIKECRKASQDVL